MALHLHIHAGRRVRTIDLTPPSLQEQYKQLVARLMEIMERQSTHDDAQPGHPFYGNQYTDVVLGPKPTEAKSKGVKNIVHELLTSGHPFSFEELKAATGAKLDQQLHNAINELKAGKHAAGALGIVKIGPGQYQVVKPNGEVAKALPKDPDDELVSVPFKAPEEKAQEAPKAPDLPNPPAEPPPIAPSPVSLPPSDEMTAVAKAVGTKMTKAEADEVYEDYLAAYNEKAVELLKNGAPVEKVALFWKQGKAQAMAQWKANTTGADQKPLPVEVFKEDKDLVEELEKNHDKYNDMPTVQAELNKKAFAKWKEATHAAKFNKPAPTPAAAFEPPKPKEPEKPAVEVTPEALKAPLSFEVPKTTVPEGHTGISTDDFVTQPGHSESGYVKGIAELHKKLHASASDAVSNKIAVEHGLTKRLKDSPHFQNMRQQYKEKMGGASLEASIISCWAGSSGDSNNRAVSAQLACRDVFGMDPSKTETKAFGSLQNAGGDEDAVHKKAAKGYGIDVSTPAKFESYKKGMQDFMLAQYHETQDHLSKLGIKELHLVRGMKFGAGGDPAKMVNLKLQPASSFSTAHGTAKSFSGGHSLFVVKVPASQVLGSFCTGYGCTSESEVVVLNHENLKAIQIGSLVGQTTTQMSSHIKQYAHNINGTPAPQKAAQEAKPAGSSAPTPSASPGFVPLPPEGTGTVATKSHKLASNGDLAGLKAHLAEVIAAGIKAPKSKAYTKELIAQLEAKQPKASKPAPVTAEGVKKNAHYYKKLKEAVFNHPIHTGVLYDALKKAGYTNEQVLSTYKKAHVNQYGEPL